MTVTLETAATPSTAEELEAMPLAEAIRALRRDFTRMAYGYAREQGRAAALKAQSMMATGDIDAARRYVATAFHFWLPAMVAHYRNTGHA